MIHARQFAAPLTVKYLMAATLAICLLIFALESIHWPLLGDCSLLHYAVFLMERGAAPYRDIYEINMPGSYFVEWAAMHLFGGGDLAWRIFDLFSLVTAVAAMVVITVPFDWFAGFWAGSLLLLVHGRDGILQLGQREMSLSVCLLAGCACLLLARRRNLPWLAFLFGVFVGAAATIKPTVLLLAPFSLALLALELGKKARSSAAFLFWGFVGWALPLTAAGVFLWRQHAIAALLTTTRQMLIYHAGLARRPVGYLLLHSVSPLLPLLVFWIVVLLLRRKLPGWERLHLLLALGFGLFSFLAQGKGYSYQRYPLLAFLLLLIAIDLADAWEAKTGPRWVRFFGLAGLAFGALFLAPMSTAMAARYTWKDLGTAALLEADLRALPTAQLAAGVQCVDSISGCTNVLYRMRLPEKSGVFYDEFLFGPSSAAAVQRNREKFMHDVTADPPAVIVVTDRLFPAGPDHFAKIALWPDFNALLERHYTLLLERDPAKPVRWWSKPETPAGYRIYVKKPL